MCDAKWQGCVKCSRNRARHPLLDPRETGPCIRRPTTHGSTWRKWLEQTFQQVHGAGYRHCHARILDRCSAGLDKAAPRKWQRQTTPQQTYSEVELQPPVLDLRNGSLRDAAERPINRRDAAGPARSVVNQPLIDRGWASGRCPVVRGGRVFHAAIGSVTRRDKKGALATRHSGQTCQLTALAIVRRGTTPDAFRKSSCGLPCLILGQARSAMQRSNR